MADPIGNAKIMVGIGRLVLVLALLALIGAWISQASGRQFLGLSQEHLFSDATVLALLGIAFLIDATLHRQNL